MQRRRDGFSIRGGSGRTKPISSSGLARSPPADNFAPVRAVTSLLTAMNAFAETGMSLALSPVRWVWLTKTWPASRSVPDGRRASPGIWTNVHPLIHSCQAWMAASGHLANLVATKGVAHTLTTEALNSPEQYMTGAPQGDPVPIPKACVNGNRYHFHSDVIALASPGMTGP